MCMYIYICIYIYVYIYVYIYMVVDGDEHHDEKACSKAMRWPRASPFWTPEGPDESIPKTRHSTEANTCDAPGDSQWFPIPLKQFEYPGPINNQRLRWFKKYFIISYKLKNKPNPIKAWHGKSNPIHDENLRVKVRRTFAVGGLLQVNVLTRNTSWDEHPSNISFHK